jgi:hypothetical protein
MIPINSAEPMVHIVFNNSLISFPLLSSFTALLLAVVVIFIVIYGLIKKLPDHIYKRFQNQFNRETELLKLIQSQVEPKKVETYLAVADLYGAMIAPQFIDQNLSASEQEKDLAWKIFSYKLQSKLFFFASDTTIERFITFKNNSTSPQATDLFSSFMVSMRQDLYKDTHLTTKDFLSVILTLKKDIGDNKT